MDFFYQQKNIKYLYFLVAVVYIIGLFIPLMANDSAQHATMAMRMYLSDNFFELLKGPNPYLDKPHMHFWLSAISFKIFGLHEWAYRIPALLFTALGAYSVYQLTKKLYSESVAHFGSLIFLTSQSIILANHDVRTDAVLTGATIFAIWQLFEYVSTRKLVSIILGAIGMGISFSTKGFYGVGIICFAIFSHIIYTKKFNVIFSYKVLIGLAMFFLSITPVLYAYYVQFGIDGVNFILWNQNVERITAKGFTKNSPDYFFFFHSLLWTFLPWAFLMYYGLFYQIKKLIKNKFKSIKGVELLTIGGVLITLLIISFSKFKLPHYLNPLLALLSVFTAGVLYNLQKDNQQKTLKVFLGFIYFMITVLTIAVILILCFTFNTPSILTFIISCVLFLVLLFSLIQKKDFSKKIVINSVLLMVFINVVLNTYFYPELLQYQGGIKLATIVNQNDSINIKDVYFYENDYSWPLDFYTGRNTPHITKEELKNINKDVWIVIRNIPLEKVEEDGFIIKEKHRIDHFRVTRLSLKFLNPKTRDSKLGDAYLLKIASKKS
ncbi:dolichyl-phosphate-mannose--protein mannosyltransferase [Tenacibaculum discolor]|uniref:Dolichyl-phosphate-mannose--protein mannosyltransferase n=1 Tax=Tenacibaculum discolor TaxID=361581 RepID=A0A2G1BXR5_9FLAO|nr:glycosyltransferase family 39 protein [Tenacibaculum discolor]MDP2541082.1 glycosyltransferase family 39 protein [Tenacibaculum discolor]PHN98796.1 dolichyl-phosphate-mannose--protein mannosyltransferase [Tenacibaculum discolor]PHO00397.1 dolichyl-phosphate-mannose--protein mannosyltransferase [Rhodobacteraceae bacterium 4F10]